MSSEGSAVGSQPVVIVSSQRWNHGLVSEVEQRTGLPVAWLSSREQVRADRLHDLDPRWVFVAHWSWLIPQDIFETFEVVIFHMTDLPYGRGGSPLQNLIVRGHEHTRITALRCVREMDAGPVYLKRDLPLLGSAEEIYLRASRIIGEMIIDIIRDEPEPVPQSGDPVIFERRRPAQSDLRDVSSLDEAHDLIRMLDAEGYPHAYLDVGPLRLSFRRVAKRSDGLHADVHIVVRDQPDAPNGG